MRSRVNFYNYFLYSLDFALNISLYLPCLISDTSGWSWHILGLCSVCQTGVCHQHIRSLAGIKFLRLYDPRDWRFYCLFQVLQSSLRSTQRQYHLLGSIIIIIMNHFIPNFTSALNRFITVLLLKIWIVFLYRYKCRDAISERREMCHRVK